MRDEGGKGLPRLQIYCFLSRHLANKCDAQYHDRGPSEWDPQTAK